MYAQQQNNISEAEDLREFSQLLYDTLKKDNPLRANERISAISTVLAPLAAATFYFVGSAAASEITKEEWVQYILIGEGIAGNFFAGKFAVNASLSELIVKPDIFRRISGISRLHHTATSVSAGLIGLAVAVTNYLLATHEDEGNKMQPWALALNIASNALYSFSVFYGAKKLLAASQYAYGFLKTRVWDESRKLSIIRQALAHEIDSRLSPEYLLALKDSLLDHEDNQANILDQLFDISLSNEDAENTPEDAENTPLLNHGRPVVNHKIKFAFDAVAITAMLFTITGFIYQTAIGTYALLANTIPEVAAYSVSAITAFLSAIGEIGFSVNAAKGLRPAIENIYKAIQTKDYANMASSLIAFVSMGISGASGYEANNETWKGQSEMMALIAGYIGLVSVSVVNTVYGTEALANFLREFKMCCRSQAAKQMTAMLLNIQHLRSSLNVISDVKLKTMLETGEISQSVLRKLNIPKENYSPFLSPMAINSSVSEAMVCSL